MPVTNSNLNVLAASAPVKMPDKGRVKAAGNQGAAKTNGGVVDMIQEMIPDISSYREQLDESLESLANSLSGLDQGIASMRNLTTQTKKENVYQEIFDQICEQLNKYGYQAFMDAQAEISADRALPLLKG